MIVITTWGRKGYTHAHTHRSEHHTKFWDTWCCCHETDDSKKAGLNLGLQMTCPEWPGHLCT